MSVGIALLVSTFVTLVPDATQRHELHHAGPVLRDARRLPRLAAAGERQAVRRVATAVPVFAAYQAIFSGGVPSASYMIQAAAWSIFLLVVGTRVFLRHEREFAIHL